MNLELAEHILDELRAYGVCEICICPGARNAPWVALLSSSWNESENLFRTYFFFEERSAAFFALGRIQVTQRPVAVVTTSGTAAGELLPAAMEGYYAGLPLILLTADRPRRYRGSGAPQTAEQKGIFGVYVSVSLDVEGPERLDLKTIIPDRPLHINACFDEPLLGRKTFVQKNEQSSLDQATHFLRRTAVPLLKGMEEMKEFLKKVKNPIIIVGMLGSEERESVIRLLLKWRVPTYFEAISGLRENEKMDSIRICFSDRIMENASKGKYPVDGFVRIGGIPTLRFWRDLESRYSNFPVLSLTSLPFSGLARPSVSVHGSLPLLCLQVEEALYFMKSSGSFNSFEEFLKHDQLQSACLNQLLLSEPCSEPGLIFSLSKKIPLGAQIYLGNSLPIREWDLAAVRENRQFQVWASRGLNGIDGQVSTFLGFADENQKNWALIGDLTALYDLSAPWILSEMSSFFIRIIVINNGGGKIFSRLFSQQEFQNKHFIRFSSWAKMWNVKYKTWNNIPKNLDLEEHHQIIEMIPNEQATDRFWKQAILDGLA